MLKPIKLYISKKTLVPTKYGINHKWRSDWKKTALLDYTFTPNIFKTISNRGVVETDAQFAKLVKDNFGTGEYQIIAWKKGRKNFWQFMRLYCGERTFRRIKKNMTQEEKELKNDLAEIRKLKRALDKAETLPEKKVIEEDLEIMEEMRNFDVEDKDSATTANRGPYPYLKSTMPVYMEHEYQEYGKSNKSAEEYVGDVW